MLSILYFFVIELLFMTLLNGFRINTSNLAIFLILLHGIYIILFLYKKYNNFSILFIFGYILRLVAMFWDIYARHIFVLIGSGGDSEGFYRVIVNISDNISLLSNNVYGGLYTKSLGLIAYFIGPNRLMLQYINVILGMLIILNSYEILKMLSIESKVLKISMFLIVFMPLSIIHSSILLRENIITFFVVLSLKLFLSWFTSQRSISVILSLVLLLLASVFHSGVIGLVAGIFVTIVFYDPYLKKYKFTLKSVIFSIFFIVISLAIYSNYNNVFLQKFSNLENVDQLVIGTTQGRGGSQYLTSFKINNPISLLLLTPVKITYFLSSPLPHYWRGLGDVISFLLDGIVYLYLFFSGIRLFNKENKNPVLIAMLVSIMSVLVIFGIGINNAGTAIRHRNKIFEYIVIFWAYSKSYSLSNKKF